LVARSKGPAVKGTVAIIDRSPGGLVAKGFAQALSPEQQAKEQEKQSKEIQKAVREKLPAGMSQAVDANPMAKAQMSQMLKGPMELRPEVLAPDTKVEDIKASLLSPVSDPPDPNHRVALVVIPENAVVMKPKGAPASAGDDDEENTRAGRFEKFEVLTRPKLDAQVTANINGAVRESLVDARLASAGLSANREEILAITERARADVKEVTRDGEKKSLGEAGFLVPMAFMFLLWISVFSAGQYLLTTTIEEKSSRVMEVLLSAVSSRELMLGKIIGHMCVGLLVQLVYGGMGIGALAFFSMMNLIDPVHIVYMLVYFFIAFFTIASFMAAIGSAVSDMREAQSLMMPAMLVLMIPMLLWTPITQNPNGMFATIASMTPPISPFVMTLRIPAAAGSTPVPIWQIAVSIGLGIAGVCVMVWLAAKIFRVGVLMYGKAPNFATLFRWVRMA
jgi:ABC-2 type transport system permease protein